MVVADQIRVLAPGRSQGRNPGRVRGRLRDARICGMPGRLPGERIRESGTVRPARCGGPSCAYARGEAARRWALDKQARPPGRHRTPGSGGRERSALRSPRPIHAARRFALKNVQTRGQPPPERERGRQKAFSSPACLRISLAAWRDFRTLTTGNRFEVTGLLRIS